MTEPDVMPDAEIRAEGERLLATFGQHHQDVIDQRARLIATRQSTPESRAELNGLEADIHFRMLKVGRVVASASQREKAAL
jgi:hypothetical protein